MENTQFIIIASQKFEKIYLNIFNTGQNKRSRLACGRTLLSVRVVALPDKLLVHHTGPTLHPIHSSSGRSNVAHTEHSLAYRRRAAHAV